MFLKEMFSRNKKLKYDFEEITKVVEEHTNTIAALMEKLDEKNNEIDCLKYDIIGWEKINKDNSQIIESAQKEISGLRILLDHKDAEIEDLKERIRGAAS